MRPPQLLEPGELRREPALARRVDDEDDVTSELGGARSSPVIVVALKSPRTAMGFLLGRFLVGVVAIITRGGRHRARPPHPAQRHTGPVGSWGHAFAESSGSRHGTVSLVALSPLEQARQVEDGVVDPRVGHRARRNGPASSRW